MTDARSSRPGWIPTWIHPRHGKIVRLSVLTGELPETVCGRMLAWFRWVDEHLDGPETGLSREAFHNLIGWRALDARKKKRGLRDYFDAMQDDLVRWLVAKPSGVLVPKFEQSFGQSARRRMKDRERKRASRTQNEDPPLFDGRTECGPNADIERTKSGRSSPPRDRGRLEQQQQQHSKENSPPGEAGASPSGPERSAEITAEAERASPLTLHNAGIRRGSTQTELEHVPWLTPQVIGIMQARVVADGGATAKNPRGLLVERLRDQESFDVFEALWNEACVRAQLWLRIRQVNAEEFLAEREQAKQVKAWEQSDAGLEGISQHLESIGGLSVPRWKLSQFDRGLASALRVMCYLAAHPNLKDGAA